MAARETVPPNPGDIKWYVESILDPEFVCILFKPKFCEVFSNKNCHGLQQLQGIGKESLLLGLERNAQSVPWSLEYVVAR